MTTPKQPDEETMKYHLQRLGGNHYKPGTTPQWVTVETYDNEEEALAEKNRRPYPENNLFRVEKCGVLDEQPQPASFILLTPSCE